MRQQRYVSVLLTVACAGCQTPLCVPWARKGERLTLAVLEGAASNGVNVEGLVSCGSTPIGVGTGDQLALSFAPGSVQGTCRHSIPLVSVPGAVSVDEDPPVDIGRAAMNARSRILVGPDCIGTLTVSLDQPANPDPTAASDWVLYRQLGVNSACADPGLVPAGQSECWDAWYVRITDPSGRVITKHPDAGM